MGQCCCGRFKDLAEPFISNDIRHEPLGVSGAFCGPQLHHQLRDAGDEIERLRAKVNRLLSSNGSRSLNEEDTVRLITLAIKHTNKGHHDWQELMTFVDKFDLSQY